MIARIRMARRSAKRLGSQIYKSINLVREWTTISAPWSIDRRRIGVVTALSTIGGNPHACATSASASMSQTLSAGLPTDPQKTARVVSTIRGAISTRCASRAMKIRPHSGAQLGPCAGDRQRHRNSASALAFAQQTSSTLLTSSAMSRRAWLWSASDCGHRLPRAVRRPQRLERRAA